MSKKNTKSGDPIQTLLAINNSEAEHFLPQETESLRLKNCPKPLSDCWEESSTYSSSDEEDLIDFARKKDKTGKPRASSAYREAIEKLKTKTPRKELVNLFPSSKEELDQKMVQAFLHSNQKIDTSFSFGNLGLLVASARLRAFRKYKSQDETNLSKMKQDNSSSIRNLSPNDAETTPKFRRLRKPYFRDKSEETFVTLWSCPVMEPNLEDFQITFPLEKLESDPSSEITETFDIRPLNTNPFPEDEIKYEDFLEDMKKKEKRSIGPRPSHEVWLESFLNVTKWQQEENNE
ncbi:UNVERIFIED_CONTAM: hypothetical protein RMT77_006468 [Armadillidium vulgare]